MSGKWNGIIKKKSNKSELLFDFFAFMWYYEFAKK